MSRSAEERAASKASLEGEVANLRTIRTDIRAALKALPAPASRTAAQKRDAAGFKAMLGLIRATLALAGVDGAADRDATEDRT